MFVEQRARAIVDQFVTDKAVPGTVSKRAGRNET
jgi:hypothetical protein